MATRKRPHAEVRESDEEASFTEDEDESEEESEGVPADLSDGDDDDDDASRKKPTLSKRLERIRSSYPDDCERSLDWALERVAEAERRVASATDPTLQQPATLLCTLHHYQLVGLRWLAALCTRLAPSTRVPSCRRARCAHVAAFEISSRQMSAASRGSSPTRWASARRRSPSPSSPCCTLAA